MQLVSRKGVTHFILAVLAGLSIAVVGLVIDSSSDVSAQSCPYGRTGVNGYCNDAERAQSRQTCIDYRNMGLTASGPWGSQWVGSRQSGSSTRHSGEGGYYNDRVYIDADATSTDVFIRGSHFRCDKSSAWISNSNYQTGTWAIQVDTVQTGSFPAGNRLSFDYGSRYHRGDFPYGQHWTNMGQELRVRMDVSGLATNNTNGPGQQTVNVMLRRCNSFDGVNVDPEATSPCGVYMQSITIIRAQQPITWSVNGNAQKNSNNNVPGENVRFRYRLANPNSSNNSNRDRVPYSSHTVYIGERRGIHSQPSLAQMRDAWQDSSRRVSPVSGNRVQGQLGIGALTPGQNTGWLPNNTGSQFRIQQDHVGSWICSYLRWQPTSHSSSSASWNPADCQFIRYTYNLVPTVNLTQDIIDSGSTESFHVGGGIDSTIPQSAGGTRSEPTINWRMSQLVYAPGASFSTGPRTGDRPCVNASYGSTLECHEDISRGATIGSGNRIPAGGSRGVAGADAVVSEDWEVGTRVCFVLSINRYSNWSQGFRSPTNVDSRQGSSDWRHSRMQCAVVGKTPSAQVHGGSLQVGRVYSGSSTNSSNIRGRLTTNSSGNYGSWGEYGLLATGSVQGVASGAALSNGSDSASQSGWSRLTYANQPGFGSYTFVNPNNPLQRIDSHFSAPTAGIPNSTVGANSSVDQVMSRTPSVVRGTASTVTLAGGTIEVGESKVLRAERVRITSDIQYSNSPVNDPSRTPQLVIIADNIDIAEGVGQVDAWLIARNAISTCHIDDYSPTRAQTLSSGGSGGYHNRNSLLSAEDCDTLLTVNGPVITDKLYLLRTAGGGTGLNAGDPAEIFNLRPDAYMWMQAQSGTNPNLIRTIQTRELPPRY